MSMPSYKAHEQSQQARLGTVWIRGISRAGCATRVWQSPQVLQAAPAMPKRHASQTAGLCGPASAITPGVEVHLTWSCRLAETAVSPCTGPCWAGRCALHSMQINLDSCETPICARPPGLASYPCMHAQGNMVCTSHLAPEKVTCPAQTVAAA